ncbi:MAG: RNA-binding protein [Gammaproteobacteria bacterium]|nr:RNA-binding protein [Gammaproteobacteria bacterium]
MASLLKKLFNIFKKNPSSNSSSGSMRKNTQKECQELYIGNIEYKTKPYELRKFFEEFGEIEYLKIIRDPKTKRSKGYGFVKFVHQNDAAKVINQSNLMVFRGRELKLAYAKDR